MRAGLDHQLPDDDLAGHLPGGHDLESVGFDGAVEGAADQDPLGLDVPLDPSFGPNGDLGLGIDRAVDSTVDVQIAV